MQISQPAPGAPRPGHLVRVRGTRWRIADIRRFDDCQLVTLTGVAPPDIGVERRILAPFDTIEPIDRPHRLRTARARLWRHAFRALVAEDTPPGGLKSVRHADVNVLPHQLEPALAVLRGLGCRVLLADDVGLGKTIQAGIVIAELRARGAADRVLVLTPAGLREQWTEELSRRFGLDARVADAATLRRQAAEMPIGLNPWSVEHVAVASIDYVKRPEVLPAVAADPWDVVVVDEAHAAAGESDRCAAVRSLASRAAFVLLLTATPHSGNRQSFVSLAALGAVDDAALLVFRRRRSDVRADACRRIHALRIRPTAAEIEMHVRLTQYTSAILHEHDGAWLPASVLHKRALSSAWSLAQSVGRRLDALTRTESAPPDSHGEQLALPLGDDDGEHTQADEPPAWPVDLGLADAARETILLRELLAAARLAARTESKLDAIRRLLRRANQPAIVFTEYRDTLQHLRLGLRRPAAVLHGGRSREERTIALRDFSSGRHTLLLATDAAGEGLNLQHTCRMVINLELPWNPMRLEQRIGRVDRIGQRQVVHAWHLVASSTGEAQILERLKARIARARADIGAPDPFGDDEERAVARAVVAGFRSDAEQPSPPPTTVVGHVALATPDLRGEAEGEARRLIFARSLCRSERRGAAASTARIDRGVDAAASDDIDRARLLLESDGAWVCRARRSATRVSLGNRILLLWRLAFEDAGGRLVESSCVGVEVRFTARARVALPYRRGRAFLHDLLASIDGDVRPLLEMAATPWREAVERITLAFSSTRLRRERGITRGQPLMPADFQPGLFDRRADRQRVETIGGRQRLDRDLAGRLDHVVTASDLRMAAPRLLLVLVP
jgi:superfamily II DNA or RNA helicase